MKNYNLYIIIVIICLISIISCDKKQVQFYPSEKLFNQEKKQIIDINKYTSVKEFYKKIIENYDKQVNSYVIINNQKRVKKIRISLRGSGLIKERNIITIYRDSIITEEKTFDILKLEKVLEKHILNNKKSYFYSDSSTKAIVSISPSDINSLKYILSIVTDTFDNLKSRKTEDLQLNVFLNRFTFSKQPIIP